MLRPSENVFIQRAFKWWETFAYIIIANSKFSDEIPLYSLRIVVIDYLNIDC